MGDTHPTNPSAEATSTSRYVGPPAPRRVGALALLPTNRLPPPSRSARRPTTPGPVIAHAPTPLAQPPGTRRPQPSAISPAVSAFSPSRSAVRPPSVAARPTLSKRVSLAPARAVHPRVETPVKAYKPQSRKARAHLSRVVAARPVPSATPQVAVAHPPVVPSLSLTSGAGVAGQDEVGIGHLPNEILLGIIDDLLSSGDYADLVALCSTHTAMRDLCATRAPERFRDLAAVTGLADYGSEVAGPSDMPTILALARGLARHHAEEGNLEARIRALYTPLDMLDASQLSAFPEGVALTDYFVSGRRYKDRQRLAALYLRDALRAMRGQKIYYAWSGQASGREGDSVIAFPLGTRPGALGLGAFGGHPIPTDPQMWRIPEDNTLRVVTYLKNSGWTELPRSGIDDVVDAPIPKRGGRWIPTNSDDRTYIATLSRLEALPLSSYTKEDIDALRDAVDRAGRGPWWPTLGEMGTAFHDAKWKASVGW